MPVFNAAAEITETFQWRRFSNPWTSFTMKIAFQWYTHTYELAHAWHSWIYHKSISRTCGQSETMVGDIVNMLWYYQRRSGESSCRSPSDDRVRGLVNGGKFQNTWIRFALEWYYNRRLARYLHVWQTRSFVATKAGENAVNFFCHGGISSDLLPTWRRKVVDCVRFKPFAFLSRLNTLHSLMNIYGADGS